METATEVLSPNSSPSIRFAADLKHPKQGLEEVPAHYRVNGPIEQRYLIDGEIKTWDGPRQKVLSPLSTSDGFSATRKELGSFPLLGEKEALEALTAAKQAFNQWSLVPLEERIKGVETVLEGMLKKRSEIINLIMWEIGKNLTDATKEFDRTIEYTKLTIAAARNLEGKKQEICSGEGISATVGQAPLGVALCVAPYNYPLNDTLSSLFPGVIMGNTIILQPPRFGTLLFDCLLEEFRDAFPKGVINVLSGSGRTLLPPLMKSGEIDCLCFIGSTGAAKAITALHPQPLRLRSILGLGAKNPGVILPDADLELSVKECVKGALSYNGQRCTSLKVIFAHESIADEFSEKLATAIDNLKAGQPWETGVQVTPLPEDNKAEYLDGLIQDAVAKGGRVINAKAGKRADMLYFPAVVYPATAEMRLYTEEQFGPVVPIVKYKDPQEVVEFLRASPFGQQASIFGKDHKALMELAIPISRLTSRVNINSQCQRGPDFLPFTGRKDSAVGTLSIEDALLAFSMPSVLATSDTSEGVRILKSMNQAA